MLVVKHVLLPLMLAASLALGLAAQEVARPNPHEQPETGASTPAGETGCEGVVDYYRDLNRAIFRADTFFDFLADESATFDDLSEREARDIVDSGEELIEDLEAMDAPAAYAEGHEGIIALMQINVDFVSFYSLDSSSVPNLNDFDAALEQIYRGEVALAEACPDEVEEVGGYIFEDPAVLEDELDIEPAP